MISRVDVRWSPHRPIRSSAASSSRVRASGPSGRDLLPEVPTSARVPAGRVCHDGTVAAGVLTIGSMLGHDDVEDRIVRAFLDQRDRILTTARTLDAGEWSRPSRCTAWTAHQLLLHVLGATAACRTTLT